MPSTGARCSHSPSWMAVPPTAYLWMRRQDPSPFILLLLCLHTGLPKSRQGWSVMYALVSSNVSLSTPLCNGAPGCSSHPRVIVAPGVWWTSSPSMLTVNDRPTTPNLHGRLHPPSGVSKLQLFPPNHMGLLKGYEGTNR